MNPEVEQAENSSPEVKTKEFSRPTISVEAGPISKLNTTSLDSPEWQKVTQETLDWLLSQLPQSVASFYKEYQQPLTIAGIAIATIPFLALAAALLEVINSIPLFAPTFELIGFGVTGWFIYRYLLFAERRQEFVSSLNELKSQIIGQVTNSKH
jgi:hypothetical protein